jgi:hypothetical protein
MTMKVSELKVGAVVALRSGGPKMVVTAWEDGGASRSFAEAETYDDAAAAAVLVDVVWCNAAGDACEAQYPAACLEEA